MKTLKMLPIICIVISISAITMGFAFHNNTAATAFWLTMEEAQEKSIEDGKPLFVFIEAEWCGICKRMLQNIFPDQRIQEKLNANYYPVIIDLDSKNPILFNGKSMTERDFARNMNVSGTPTTIFFDSSGEELGRQVGFIGIEQLQRLLAYVNSDRFNEVSFDEFEGDR